MTEREKMMSGKLYIAGNELFEDRKRAKKVLSTYNNTDYEESLFSSPLLKEILGSTKKEFYVEPPFYCDYGYNIHIGEKFYANYNLTILDCAKVTIGDNVFFAPGVSLYTAGHPVDARLRNQDLEYAFPITIGSNVWIGGGTIVNPNITIGDNVVIGSGSVVTHDIPSDVVAAGNPCRVLRLIGEQDKSEYFKGHFVEE